MTDTITTLASVVILPEQIEEQEVSKSPGSTKRRRSSIDESVAKKARLSTDIGDDTIKTGPEVDKDTVGNIQEQNTTRRQHGQLEERRRGQRLFGALLGTLTKSATSGLNKRRSELESKKQEKLKADANEEAARQRAQKEKITRRRRADQVVFDKHTLHVERTNSLAQAHFLKTDTLPELYYLPKQLLLDQVRLIESQLASAKGMNSTQDGITQAGTTKEPAALGQASNMPRPEPVAESEINPPVVKPKPNNIIPTGGQVELQPTEQPDSTDSRMEDTNIIKSQSEISTDHNAMPTKQQSTSSNPQDTKSAESERTGDDEEEVVKGDEDDVLY